MPSEVKEMLRGKYITLITYKRRNLMTMILAISLRNYEEESKLDIKQAEGRQ